MLYSGGLLPTAHASGKGHHSYLSLLTTLLPMATLTICTGHVTPDSACGSIV